ncbi:MAG: hypothetical protein M0Q91_05395 [Methanoregula sp.]|jgi:hypothetical protein|nr:hypothetical protein [Methanoregula sp.]
MTGEKMIKTTVLIPEDLYILARHYGLENLGKFVREALQGFVDGQEEPVTDSVAMRARQIAVDLRLKSMQQRKLIQDAELERELKEQSVRSRKDLIEQVTRSQVARQKFTHSCLPEFDDQWSSAEGVRKQLVDEIAHECQLDLQWKDIDRIVREAVRA